MGWPGLRLGLAWLACLAWLGCVPWALAQAPRGAAAPAGESSPVLTVAAPASLNMYGPLMAALLGDAGIRPTIQFYPTARSRLLFVSGMVDAEFFRIANLPPDYPPDVITIGPLQTVRFGMFVRAGDPYFVGKPADFLWQQSIGYVRGTLAVEGLIKARHIKADAIDRASASRMLLAGRLNVVVDSERLMLAHLLDTQSTESIVLAATVLEEPTYLLLSGRARALEPAIRQAVQRWMESGRWQREYQAINRANGLPPDMSLVRWPPAQ